MTLLLGIDTGGTYTDAVLMRGEQAVVASAKALTTRNDLAIGVGNAVRAVLAEAGVGPEAISMASLSTTLATNALVEGQGGRVGLIYIGFREGDPERHGLSAALRGDPILSCAGGHGHSGAEAQALDAAAIEAFLREHGRDVGAFAVAAQFATRNPAHELQAARLVRDITGRPVSASHQLSARLNGPRRAMTALLNARLIGMIEALIGRAEAILREIEIAAPLMVVRGDGALMSSAQARERPIETILSGPAASAVGARWLTAADLALVSDIGGTTTDVALLRDGRPAIDPEGARVGPYRTMVEAVAMRTTGLGGDSEVQIVGEGLAGGVTLGPRRLLPVSLLGAEAGPIVHAALDRQLASAVPGELDARFVRGILDADPAGLGPREVALLARVGDAVHPLSDILRARIDHGALARLAERGLVQLGGVTPSDAAHVLGLSSAWDLSAADKALRLFGRRRTGGGALLAGSAQDMARLIVDRLTAQSAEALLETAFGEEHVGFDAPPEQLARHELMRRRLASATEFVRLDTGLKVPVIALGASAASYYPAVAAALGTQAIVPDHAAVANAIGAVVGRIDMRRSGTVTVPGEGRFRVHLATGPQDFPDLESALELLESVLRDEARAAAMDAGAGEVAVQATRDVRSAGVEGREVVVEARIEVEAVGRPRVATGT
ncbi:hydantoinase/oxoprolinase family protein [Sulfitobacter sp. D35]|uniref:hydantoinase/oxoprolinase family protein n=1 Tax=Sulfitobacter sp. D35 TaxID=3083252 RepID=UPI00296FADC9|nr:hydantoinase/oxoprolinase family protein [Sulfitobacter sp. D35]MDW4498190.1 hydantoinase/oxoprolinase family protein [Sulfitobacter sp. D35]